MILTRLADVKEDAEQIFEGAKDFISRMDNSEFLPVDEDWYAEYIINLLSSAEVEVIVAEVDGNIVAGIGMVYSPMLWNPHMIQAEELFWWASPDAPPRAAIQVMKHALSRVPTEGVKTVVGFKSLTSSPDSVGRVYERLGLREAETSYIGVV